MLRKAFSVVAVALVVALPCAAADASAELTAVVSQVSGAVRLSGPGVGSPPLASPWQVIRAGVTMTLPNGTAAGVVCSSRRFVRLRGPVSWAVSGKACAAGSELTPAVYAALAPQAGRFKVVRGLLVLERETRGDTNDDPLAPVILKPRNTIVRSPRPTVGWTRVPSAAEYLVEWNGRGAGTSSTRLNASDLSCAAGADRVDECSRPWPAERPDLPPGETFFLTISARAGIADPWHSSAEVKVQTLELAAARTLEARLQDLEGLGLAGAALETARAGLLADRGLYTDAAQAYRRALDVAPTPELRITLADVELSTGLYRFAELLYRQSLSEEEPAVRAAAAFGLGRVEYARGLYREAAASFRRAQELYAGLELRAEFAAARDAARKAVDREGK